MDSKGRIKRAEEIFSLSAKERIEEIRLKEVFLILGQLIIVCRNQQIEIDNLNRIVAWDDERSVATGDDKSK